MHYADGSNNNKKIKSRHHLIQNRKKAKKEFKLYFYFLTYKLIL